VSHALLGQMERCEGTSPVVQKAAEKCEAVDVAGEPTEGLRRIGWSAVRTYCTTGFVRVDNKRMLRTYVVSRLSRVTTHAWISLLRVTGMNTTVRQLHGGADASDRLRYTMRRLTIGST
jgi:hypothetical protein